MTLAISLKKLKPDLCVVHSQASASKATSPEWPLVSWHYSLWIKSHRKELWSLWWAPWIKLQVPWWIASGWTLEYQDPRDNSWRDLFEVIKPRRMYTHYVQFWDLLDPISKICQQQIASEVPKKVKHVMTEYPSSAKQI